MPLDDLREFIDALEKAEDLKIVNSSVSVDLEIAEILRRSMYSNGPAILFKNVQGYDIPVAGNLFGSDKRMRIALGVDKKGKGFENLSSDLLDLLKAEVPTGLVDKVKFLPKIAELSGFAPKIVKKGPVMEVIETNNPSMSFLPALKTWPKDAGRFITFGEILTKNPETGIRNLGIYRMQLFDDKTAAMHWQTHKRGAQHFKMMAEKGERIQVAVIIGADPATAYSGAAPVPEGLDKMLFSGILRRKGVEMVKCQTVDLEVPARAEIVLEGYVDPKDMRVEGPFGDHIGYYTTPEPYPTFHLTGVMRREKPIYLTTVVGKPVLEDAYIGKVIERSFLPLIKVFQPEVIDVNFPPAGWFQGLAIVSIKKRYPGQARKVMLGLWGLGQFMLTKMLVVVDETINVHDMNEVTWAVTTRVDPARDIMILENMPTDTLDPASPKLNFGSKLGVDATVKSREEGFDRDWEEEVSVDRETSDLVTRKWKSYGLD
ncbi:MAG: menaquinone biosynthesis decarboxylase [Thaumarchaeota archaeon]|nr:menaquinone biosynthesis decarboxylase [Nitrososphaerota archaeon]MCL5319013.1 menaquinone biosynthesis decarboxylase [Nitrososphaerota archaeon]